MNMTDMIQNWYGYGQWSAPYWFLGPEPGMADKGDDLEKRCEAWLQIGGGELVDCIAHHHAFGYDKWHKVNPPTQSTWRQLIRLLLSFKGIEATLEEIREYQRTQWGTIAGETCVIELSSLAAPNLSTCRDRDSHREQRVAFLRDKISKYQPTFVVMYGDSQTKYWEQIVGKFDQDGIREVGRTIAISTPHPQKHGTTNNEWIQFGKFLRERCDKLRSL